MFKILSSATHKILVVFLLVEMNEKLPGDDNEEGDDVYEVDVEDGEEDMDEMEEVPMDSEGTRKTDQ